MNPLKIAVIGGGASGFFSAIQCKYFNPNSSVTIFEKSSKVLSKVKVSGGGRCNVTNAETSIPKLSSAYPRGQKALKKLLHEFSTSDIVDFFEKRGVPLYAQEDGRIFPKSNDSQSVINCFMKEIEQLNITLQLSAGIQKIIPQKDGEIELLVNEKKITFDRVIVCTGGHPKISGYKKVQDIHQPLIPPLPSLFSFNMPKERIKNLMGISIETVKAKIEGEKLLSEGPLLITHWGMSGPAILKLSAFGARKLAEKNYQFSVLINWTADQNDEEVAAEFKRFKHESPQLMIKNLKPFDLPKRLWLFLISKIELDPEQPLESVNKKSIQQLANLLTNDRYIVSGKTTFKEEFVTAGGVDLKSIDLKTMESKVVPHLYFSGEVLDIDGITGGYNFQSAWSTAYVAAKNASQ